MPALNTIEGMGDNAAIAVAEAAKDGKFLSKDDFRQRTKVTKSTIDLMADLGLLGDMPDVSFFVKNCIVTTPAYGLKICTLPGAATDV